MWIIFILVVTIWRLVHGSDHDDFHLIQGNYVVDTARANLFGDVTVGAGNDTYNYDACFLILCRNNEMYDVLSTIQNVQDRLKFHNYPFIFLNDQPFTEQFITTVEKFLQGHPAKFGTIPHREWSVPLFINTTKMTQDMQAMVHKDVIYGNSLSYRNMCRWYSGFFYNHPLLQSFKYYWRLEPGVKLLCDIDYDIFQQMQLQNKKFAFTLTLFEYADTIPSLWHHFQQFKLTHPFNGELLDLVQDNDHYNLCHFWSNFEIARFDIFRSPEYQDFFNYFDRTGGFYYERWGDAPIHTLFVSLYLEKKDLWYLDDVGYVHEPYTQCPPHGKRCICDPQLDFTYSFQSCTSHFLKVLNS